MPRKRSAAAAVLTFVAAGSAVFGGAALADASNTAVRSDANGDRCSITTVLDGRATNIHQRATATSTSCSLVSSVAQETTDAEE
jgi:hypothetical protein